MNIIEEKEHQVLWVLSSW